MADGQVEKLHERRSFFGRRKGHALQGRKQRLMDELLPQRRLDLSVDPPEELRDLFPKKPQNLVLEIGFGGGEHLAHQAVNHRDSGFIGVEPFINGMAKMLGQIDDQNLDNVRLYDDDAAFLLEWLPAESLDRVDLLYPDPWPKRRNWKRRFVNPINLARICRVLKPGGAFRFASDIDTYVNWTLGHVARSEGLKWTAWRPADWHEPFEGWLRTRYEVKAIREGRRPCYLYFTRTG